LRHDQDSGKQQGWSDKQLPFVDEEQVRHALALG